jgi:hypothetical protein
MVAAIARAQKASGPRRDDRVGLSGKCGITGLFGGSFEYENARIFLFAGTPGTACRGSIPSKGGAGVGTTRERAQSIAICSDAETIRALGE